jgi:hypothetical protein
VHFVPRQAECAGDLVAREMRLLRAGPQGRAVGPRIDDGAGRTHAGIRLERPPGFPKSNRVVSPEFRSSINHKTRLQERSAILQIAVGNFIATALLS